MGTNSAIFSGQARASANFDGVCNRKIKRFQIKEQKVSDLCSGLD